MKPPKKILSLLKREGHVLIAIHVNPDGDALGSALALSGALESIGKKTFIYCKDPVPKFYRFLPGFSKIKSNLNRVVKNTPLLILLDCNSRERAALDCSTFSGSVVIDHHETENDFGDVRWIRRDAAATGLMVFYLIRTLGIAVTRNIATNLYAAISVDTGTFRYSNTHPDVLEVSAELIKYGANPSRIADCLYERWDIKRFNLLRLALNTLEVKNCVAMIHLTMDMFQKTGTIQGDTENFSNFPRMIDAVKVSAFFREYRRGRWRVSLRSKGEVNVAKIAEMFGGGGHRNAAGLSIKGSLFSAKKALLGAARKCEVKKLRS
jgi:phosphoesterase RecJ-like protein